MFSLRAFPAPWQPPGLGQSRCVTSPRCAGQLGHGCSSTALSTGTSKNLPLTGNREIRGTLFYFMPALCNVLADIPEAPCLTMDIIEQEAPHTTFLRDESHKTLHTAQEPSSSKWASGLVPSGCFLWQQGTAQPHHHRPCSEPEIGCPLSPCTPGTGHLPQSVLWEAVLR